MEGCQVAPPDIEKVFFFKNKKNPLHPPLAPLKESLSPHFSCGIFRIGQNCQEDMKEKS